MKNWPCNLSGSNRGIRYSRFQRLVLGAGVTLIVCVLALPAATPAQNNSETAPAVEKQPAIKKMPVAEKKPAPEPQKAAEKKPTAESKKTSDIKAATADKPIHITADLAQHDRNKNLSEFIGNVKVTQGESFLKTDRLQIFHKKTTDTDKETTDAEAAIDKIIAIGHVYVNFDNKVAVAQRAIYNFKTGVLVLSGKGTKVTMGKNSIAGKKITVYRNEDRITVEGGSKNRVKAVFFSGGKGFNLKKGFGKTD